MQTQRSIDVLSEVLQSVHQRSWGAGHMTLTCPWGLRVSSGPSHFYYVKEGPCSLTLDGKDDPRTIDVGDFVMTAPGIGHTLRDRPSSPVVVVPPLTLPETLGQWQSAASSGEGAGTSLICGVMVCEEPTFAPLTSALPAIMHIRGADGRAPGLFETLRLLVSESATRLPGTEVVVSQLAHILFVQAVRSCLSISAADQGTWLAALLDPEIGPVLACIHRRPEYPWTVAALAEKAGMSRSAFASRFHALVSKPPLRYLLDCRMRKACHMLLDAQYGLKEIAAHTGYTSEAAFSHAFKRWAGKSPGLYRQAIRGPTRRPF